METHPQRQWLYDEIHARPYPQIAGSVSVSHFVILDDRGDRSRHHDHLSDLGRKLGFKPPAPGVLCHYQKLPDLELRWEQHQEFCTYTVIRPIAGEVPFNRRAVDALPADWVNGICGLQTVDLDVWVERRDQQPATLGDIAAFFDGQQLFGGNIVDGKATMWTSFKLHQDNVARVLVIDSGLSRFQAGRTLQRIIEIETYRILSLLGLPAARGLVPKVAQISQSLADLSARISSDTTAARERTLLNELSELAASVEKHRANTSYRFAATRAYYSFVRSRLENLREEHWPEVSSWTKFLERRLGPAVSTCESVDAQLAQLSHQAARTNGLLRTRVDMTIEAQNRRLLASIDRRGRMQVRLQQTVEGLSVAAISYYVVSLVKLVLEGIEPTGVDIGFATAISAVVVVSAVWWLTYRVRKKLTRHRTLD